MVLERPRSATGSVGGHPALDFVNTVAWRLDPARRVDRLPDCSALVRWTAAAGLLDAQRAKALLAEATTRSAAGSADRARTLREVLYRVLHPVATGGTPNAEDVELLRQAVTRALAQATISTLVPLRWSFTPCDLTDLPTALTISAWRLLQFEDLSRLRQCADSGCGWLFLDRTKNASRRWCSSADCGNRARARRHHRRRR